jgi:hypothetical protein
MAQRAKAKVAEKRASAAKPTGKQVAAYLESHPDFFAHHPDLLMRLAAPSRWSGDAVVDIQKFMVDTLRGELEGLRRCVQEVIETSRSNLSTQTRTHAAILALLAAEDLQQLLEVVHDDLPVLLDVDISALAFEPAPAPFAIGGDLRRLAQGEVDRWIGSGQEVALFVEMCDGRSVFDGGAQLVRSAAFARVQPAALSTKGVLALGSRHPAMFHPGQGTDLLRFLARVVEHCLQRFLDSPS